MIDFLKTIWAWILSLFDDGKPKDGFFKCSMFFPASPNFPGSNNKGVDSPLGFADIDAPDTDEHRRFCIDSIAQCGGDTLIYIAEKLFNNASLQEKLTGEHSDIVKYARSKGVKRWIVSIKNDTNILPFKNVEALIQQLAICYKWANKNEMAFLTCLESDELMSVAQVKQMIGWCQKYAPDKRVLVGSQSFSFLKAFKGTDAELWLETPFHPFQLNMQNAEAFVQSVLSLNSYGEAWAGEYGRGQGDAAKYVTRRAREIGCVGIGSYVQ